MRPLAIAFNYPYSPSETFIRTHVECLAPGRTIALGFGAIPQGDFLDRLLLTSRTPQQPYLKRKLEGLASYIRTGSRLGASAESVNRAVTTLRHHGCEDLFVEYGHFALATMPIAKALNIKMSVQFHGFDMSSFVRLPGIIDEYNRLFPLLSNVIVGSQYLAKRAVDVGCPAEIIKVVPYGIDTEMFAAQSPEKTRGRRFVAIGRLTPKKAPHVTIRAFARVLRSFPDATLDIVGDGELRRVCENEIKRLQLHERVTLHGVQSSTYIREILLACDVFVQHSVTSDAGDVESFGISLVEAMSTGLPCVVTDHNGFVDTIVDGTTGFLVPEHDEVVMAERMQQLLEDPCLAEKMGRAGIKHARERFDFRRTIPALRNAIGYS